ATTSSAPSRCVAYADRAHAGRRWSRSGARGYCDVEFGFSNDSSQNYQDRSEGQRKIPGHPPLCLPLELSAVPCLLAPPDNGFPEGCPSRFPCFPLRGETYPSGARGDETERMDTFDWNESPGCQWTFPEARGRDLCSDGGPVRGRSDEAWKVENQHVRTCDIKHYRRMR
ncbi:MAG: hypothetical protein GY696_27700, partial [Gammaproteobacteria bacterium]|nr:hypothetical protein [Gammaproteobacteria bacterium]